MGALKFCAILLFLSSGKGKGFINHQVSGVGKIVLSSLTSFIESNPNYVNTSSATNESTQAGNDTKIKNSTSINKIVDDEYGVESKKVWRRALARSRTTSKIARRYKNQIIMAAAIFAFRRDIFSFIKSQRIHPTSILKVFFILDLLRKIKINLDPDDASDDSMTFFFNRLSQSTLLSAYNPPSMQHFMFERLNDRYIKDKQALRKALYSLSKPSVSHKHLNMTSSSQWSRSSEIDLSNANNTVIVFEVKADITMSQLSRLRDTVSFLISLLDSLYETRSMLAESAQDIFNNIEIVVLLESSGGSASPYGLAATQLKRLRRYSFGRDDYVSQHTNPLKLTICVDTIAASGGYMIACQASPGSLLAAPFAIIGSIGVFTQSVSFYDTLKQWGIKPVTFSSGKGKHPVGPLAEVTNEGMEVVQETVDKTHEAFKKIVVEARGTVLKTTIDDVANGKIWLGEDAMKLGLVDEIISSDEYIGERIRRGNLVLKLHQFEKGRLTRLLSHTSPFSSCANFFMNFLYSCLNLVVDFRNVLAKLPGVLDGDECNEYAYGSPTNIFDFMT